MAIRKSEAEWEGSLKEGHGKMKLASGAFEGAYTWSSRFENGQGTNPEELLGAAHAGCYSMSVSSNLGRAGFTPERIHTTASVTIEPVDGRNKITHIALDMEAKIPGISQEKFMEIAQYAKENCPVSAVLTGVPITLNARLLS
ncbi:MAG: OsmC family protein [Anaerolineaceae bacterium]|nr:OsmC family protein [Anaerolineaceae bacterium]